MEGGACVQPRMGQRAAAALEAALKAAMFAWVAAVVGEGGSAARRGSVVQSVGGWGRSSSYSSSSECEQYEELEDAVDEAGDGGRTGVAGGGRGVRLLFGRGGHSQGPPWERPVWMHPSQHVLPHMAWLAAAIFFLGVKS